MQSPLQKILHSLIPMAQTPGCTGLDLDGMAKNCIEILGAEPAFLGFNNFPNVLCVSINETVVHGVPTNKPFEDGDIVSLDLGLKMNGEYDDGALTIVVGKASKVAKKLLKGTREALEAGIQMAKPGYTTNDIGRAIWQTACKYDLVPVDNYGGHGISSELHEEPFVPNYSMHFPNHTLVAGQRIAIEPMFSTKGSSTYIGPDGFSVVLKSGLAAHFERTVTI
jgi:methionyl aminopeptidase